LLLSGISKKYSPFNTSPNPSSFRAIFEPTTLTLHKLSGLKNRPLTNYLTSRGISKTVASLYLKEALVLNTDTGKKFYALCLPNVNEGYELRNKVFKGCIAPKSISFIRGSKKVADEMNVFEGAFDFLSALEDEKTTQLKGDSIILNSTALLEQAIVYIKTNPYKRIYAWLDNDEAGEKATQKLNDFAAQVKIAFERKNDCYRPHKDVNAARMHKMKL
jgi:hypothetical protein